MSRDTTWVILAYLTAGAVALVVGAASGAEHPVAVAAWADLAATVVVFLFSFAFRNSSFYDAYWSVAPLPILAYWTLRPESGATSDLRAVVVLGLVTAWSVRLTWNWYRGWGGLGHEDWRYVDLREASGGGYRYWLVSFLGIHMFPTVAVFLGCVPLYFALAAGTRPLGALDVLAAAVTATAILLEAVADQQLRGFRTGERGSGDLLSTGLWARCRHPNYLGEILFWWGLYLFGLAAAPGAWWTIIGALAITVMFRVVSLPMIETRMRERRPEFAVYAEKTPLVIPRLLRRTS